MSYKIGYVGAAEGFEETARVFQSKGEVVHLDATAESISAFFHEGDGLLDASMKTTISDEMIRKAPALKIISCATTGSDHIKRGEIDKRSIPVRTLKEDRKLLLNITPAAELSWSLLMACARKLPAAAADVLAGNWVREDFPGIMLHGKTLGLVGLGRLGTWMSRYARAFGMKVIGYDPFIDSYPEGVEAVALADLAGASDFLSVHVHLSDETAGLVSRKILETCKPGMIVINTSRGALLDQSALLDGLKSGRIGGAGLDVLEGEPEIDKHPLVEYARNHDNVIITPHCGGFSPDAVRVVCRHAAEKILACLEEAK